MAPCPGRSQSCLTDSLQFAHLQLRGMIPGFLCRVWRFQQALSPGAHILAARSYAADRNGKASPQGNFISPLPLPLIAHVLLHDADLCRGLAIACRTPYSNQQMTRRRIASVLSDMDFDSFDSRTCLAFSFCLDNICFLSHQL